jgi:hypothetical protein
MAQPAKIIRTTADIRAKLLKIWHQVDERSISAAEARLHISLARAVLETMKVEIAAAHLAQQSIAPITLGAGSSLLSVSPREQ